MEFKHVLEHCTTQGLYYVKGLFNTNTMLSRVWNGKKKKLKDCIALTF